ncbi:MAG: type II toxin-antitoxin system Phd/YefM family antitoxin [Candidatus Nealsonbacteria bacterium]
MDTKTTLSISEARKEIFKIAERVQKSSIYYTLTEKGKPKAVILSAEEFESWQETLEVTRSFPNLEKDLKTAEKDFKKRKCVTLEEVLSKEGFILAGK